MNYRPDIDGLRAFAVLPVILFHAGLPWLGGGYTGVDIFFVISGFLITSIIIKEKEVGKFSYIDFYERRARRILPALFLVIITLIPFAWMWMTPNELKDFAQSVFAVNFFASNILFWKEDGYFSAASELKPLLHTWSLAVEEQFYIFFPIVITLCWRFGLRILGFAIFLIAIASLGLSIWLSGFAPSANFFLIPGRAWELMIGSLAALYLHKNAIPQNKLLTNSGSLIGLALITVTFFLYNEDTPFPGLYALPPVIGAAMIILFSCPGTLTHRLLSWRPLVFIGLISYSAYLWHHPLFALARIRSFNMPDLWVFLSLAALSLILATLSYYAVERPFRNKSSISRKTVFLTAAIVSALLIASAVLGQLNKGFPTRVPDFNQALFTETMPAGLKNCGNWEIPEEGACLFGARDHKPSIALIGDSHARMLINDLDRRLKDAGQSAVQLTVGSCPAIPQLYMAERSMRCAAYNEDVYNYIRANKTINTVIIASRWVLHVEGSRFDNQEGGVEFGNVEPAMPVGLTSASDMAERQAGLGQAMQRGVDRYLSLGKNVILIYPVPELGWNPETSSFKLMRFENQSFDAIKLSTSYQVFKDRSTQAYALLEHIPEAPNLHIIKPEKLFCDSFINDRCAAIINGKTFYRDDDHLSDEGASLINRQIMDAIPKAQF